MSSLSCQNFVFVQVGSEEMFQTLEAANVNMLGASDHPASFFLAVPTGASDWTAYEVSTTVGDVIRWLRQSMLYDLTEIFNMDLSKSYSDSGVYDCEFAQLAHLWHQMMDPEVRVSGSYRPGVRRLTHDEISWLIATSDLFHDDVIKNSECGVEGIYDLRPMLMDGYGSVTVPDVSGCVQPPIALPGGETYELPPGEPLPVNELPPPPGITPVTDRDNKKQESSVLPWVVGGAVVLGVVAVALSGKKRS